MSIEDKIFGRMIPLLAILLVILFYADNLRKDQLLKKTSYQYLELKLLYKNYKIVEKECINDTCYYLRLSSPIDSKTVKVKVKDYVFFNWYVNDCIK